jgi:hypothetical protein
MNRILTKVEFKERWKTRGWVQGNLTTAGEGYEAKGMPKAPPLPLLWRPESGRLEDGRPHSRESGRNVALDSLVLTQDVELGLLAGSGRPTHSVATVTDPPPVYTPSPRGSGWI